MLLGPCMIQPASILHSLPRDSLEQLGHERTRIRLQNIHVHSLLYCALIYRAHFDQRYPHARLESEVLANLADLDKTNEDLKKDRERGENDRERGEKEERE